MIDYRLFSKINSRVEQLDLVDISQDIDHIFYRFSDQYDVYVKLYLSYPQADGYYHLIWDIGENSIIRSVPNLVIKKINLLPSIDFKPTIEFGWTDNIDHLPDDEIIKKVDILNRMEKLFIENIRAHFDIKINKIYYCEVNWRWIDFSKSGVNEHPFRARYILDHIYHK